LKKLFLFAAAIFLSITVKAQSGYNYYEFGVGADASYERGYTNVTNQYNHPAINFNLIYNYNPYLPIELEVQKGTLSGGGLTQNLDRFGRQYNNDYLAVILHADFQLGAGIDYEGSWFLNVIKNFYVGTGFGFIHDNNTVQRTNIIATNGPTSGPNVYVFPGMDTSLDFMIPLRFGYEFKIFDSYNQPSMAIDLGYIHNIAFGEGLDGYDDPTSKFKNNALDQYRQIVIGFKYYFGTTVSYNKLVRTFRTY
jgi:hypothetical protein